MKNITGAQGAFIARLLIEAYQSKGQRILEAGYTGQKKDKRGHTRYYADGRQVKNPNAKEKANINAAAGQPLPAGQAPSHNDAATRVDALHADTPPEHVAALANDLMKMSVADLTKMAKAPAEEEPKQKRANAGGEVGPNGEHYKGGAFIATTELPKAIKDKFKRAAGDGMETVRDLQGNATREKPPSPDMMSIMGTMLGTFINRKGEVNAAYLDYLQASPEKRKQVADLAEKFRAGENWAPINDYPDVALAKHIYRLADAGLPIAGSLLGRLKDNADFQKYYKKQTEKAAATAAPTPAPAPEAPAVTAPPAPTAGMSADANALDALRLKSNKKTHNPAHINPEALSSLKAQGFIDEANKLTPAGRTHLYAEKLKGAPAPTGTAAATPAAPKPKWKRANRNKDSLISIVKRKGGINSKSLKTDYDYQADIIEGGLLHAIRKQGMGLDEMAASLQVEGHIIVPEGVDPGDYLLDRMKGRHHSALKDYDKELASDEEAYYKAKQEAQQGGHDEQAIESSRTSGTEIGVNEGGQRGSSTVDEWDNSGAGETGSGEKSGTVSGDGYDSADANDYDRNAGQDGPVDNSFDFGANADEAPAPTPDEAPAPAPAPTAAAPPPDDAVARHMQRQAFTGVDSQGRQWQNGELVAAKDDEPAPAGKAEPEPEKKSNKFENPGDVITPSSQSRTGENPLEVVSIKDGWALVGYANRPDGPRVRMPSESLDLFRQDQQGRVDLPDHTGSEAIDKISNGKGKLLGSGDDGFAYDAGDKVVKVSTTAPFHAFGHEHRAPAEAVHRLKGQAEINNDMIKAGVPGLLPQTFEEHGNRGFITMEKLDTTTKLTPEQVDEVARNIEQMHKLGYVVGDQIQVGIDFAGHPKIFDTGKAVKAGSGGYSKEDHIDYDNSNLERFFKDNGLTYEDPEQKKLTKLRDSTRAQIEKIKAAPKDIDQEKAQFLLHSFSLHLNLLAHQTGGVLYAYAMADDPDVKKLELIARHTIDTDSFHDKDVKKLKPMDAPAPAAAAPAPAANTDLFGNPSKATAPKGPETMPGLFGDAVPIAPDAPAAAAGEPLPGSDNPLDRAGAGRGRQDATQDMFGLFGPATKNKIDQVNNGPDEADSTPPEPAPAAAAAAAPTTDDPDDDRSMPEHEAVRQVYLLDLPKTTTDQVLRRLNTNLQWRRKTGKISGSNAYTQYDIKLALEEVLTQKQENKQFKKNLDQALQSQKPNLQPLIQERDDELAVLTQAKEKKGYYGVRSGEDHVRRMIANSKIKIMNLNQKIIDLAAAAPAAAAPDPDPVTEPSTPAAAAGAKQKTGKDRENLNKFENLRGLIYAAIDGRAHPYLDIEGPAYEGENRKIIAADNKERITKAVKDLDPTDESHQELIEKAKRLDLINDEPAQATTVANPTEPSTPAAKPGIEKDFSKQQEIKNSLAQGEGIIKHGKKVSGQKYSADEINGIVKSVNNERAKLGQPAFSGTDAQGREWRNGELVAAKDEPTPAQTKEPWEMSQDEAVAAMRGKAVKLHGEKWAANNLDRKTTSDFLGQVKRNHRSAVQDAIDAGKKVDPSVLADYPDIQSAPAPAAAEPAEPAAALSTNAPGVSLSDVPYDLALNAHRGTSFVPEKRAKQRQEDYVNQMQADWEHLSKLAKTPQQQEVLKAEFERYKAAYLAKYKAGLSADSRILSPMISGPAKFPTRRNEKANAASQKRHEESIEFRKRALVAAAKAINPVASGGPVLSSDPEAVQTLQAQVGKLEKEHEQMKNINVAFSRFLKNPASLATSGLSEKSQALIKKFADTPPGPGDSKNPFPNYMITNSSANIRRIHDRIETLSKLKAMPEKEEKYSGGVTISHDPDDARIRIKFPGKPSPEVIKQIKSRGFIWSPSYGTWQRQLNGNGTYAASELMKALGHEKTTTEAVMPATDPHADKIKLIQAIIARRGIKPPQPKAQAKKIPEASEDADPRVKRIRELMDAYC